MPKETIFGLVCAIICAISLFLQLLQVYLDCTYPNRKDSRIIQRASHKAAVPINFLCVIFTLIFAFPSSNVTQFMAIMTYDFAIDIYLSWLNYVTFAILQAHYSGSIRESPSSLKIMLVVKTMLLVLMVLAWLFEIAALAWALATDSVFPLALQRFYLSFFMALSASSLTFSFFMLKAKTHKMRSRKLSDNRKNKECAHYMRFIAISFLGFFASVMLTYFGVDNLKENASGEGAYSSDDTKELRDYIAVGSITFGNIIMLVTFWCSDPLSCHHIERAAIRRPKIDVSLTAKLLRSK